MINTKLEAIKTLHNAMQHMPEFKKKWTDWIQMSVMEEMQDAGIYNVTKLRRVSRKVAERAIAHFDPTWWETLGGLGNEKQNKDEQTDKGNI